MLLPTAAQGTIKPLHAIAMATMASNPGTINHAMSIVLLCTHALQVLYNSLMQCYSWYAAPSSEYCRQCVVATTRHQTSDTKLV